MPPIDFTNAFYIKLGRGGRWEADSIETGKLRFGWSHQSIENINAKRWDVIEQQLREEHRNKPPGVATTDLNGLKNIFESTQDDVWITFFQSKLWWTRLATSKVKQDSTSKFRRTAQPWSDRSASGRLLVINDLPGKIAQLQGDCGVDLDPEFVYAKCDLRLSA